MHLQCWWQDPHGPKLIAPQACPLVPPKRAQQNAMRSMNRWNISGIFSTPLQHSTMLEDFNRCQQRVSCPSQQDRSPGQPWLVDYKPANKAYSDTAGSPQIVRILSAQEQGKRAGYFVTGIRHRGKRIKTRYLCTQPDNSFNMIGMSCRTQRKSPCCSCKPAWRMFDCC